MTSRRQRGGPVVLDLQAIQSPDHRGRGIARYAYELAVALVASRPDLVGTILLNPALAPPGEVEPLVSSGKVAYAGDAAAFTDDAKVFHCVSPFELKTPLEQVWPREASRRGLLLALTVYDLIPELLAHHYLREPGPRRRYRTRLQLLRAADHLLAISPAAAEQVRERLEVPPEKVSVVGTGTSPRFCPPASRDEAGRLARAEVPGLEREFVLYPAGTDYRKNVEALIRAYAELPPALRRRWQLAVACDMTEQPFAHYSHVARTLGISDRLLLTRFVSDDALLHLYQSAALVVFPSLAEGYGLPVAEALACGAPAIGSEIPALAELLAPEQRFDPSEVEAITAALAHALTDEGWRALLAARAAVRPPVRWSEVAARTAGVYEQLLARPLHRWRRRPSVAFVTPLPPAPTGVSHHSLRLAEELAAAGDFDLDVFADGLDREPYAPVAPAGTEVFSARSLPAIDGLRGGYETVLYAFGNSDNHVQALELLRRRSGVVLAHDVRLTNLYAHGAKNRRAVPGGLPGSISRLYGDAFPAALGARGRLDPSEEEHYGILMAREVIGLAERYLVSSEGALSLAALDAAPGDSGKLAVLPFAAEPPVAGRSGFEELASEPVALPPDGVPVIAALGILHPIRQPARLLEAFAIAREGLPDAVLAFVGPAPRELRDEILALAKARGAGDSVVITGQIDTASFLAWVARATVAVQLRERWNGEASGTVGECLVAGVPLVVSDLGWMHELPDDCVVKVDPAATTAELAAIIASVVGDDGRRRALRSAALDFAPRLSFRRAAEALARELLGGAQSPSGGDSPAGRTARSTRRTGSRNAGRS